MEKDAPGAGRRYVILPHTADGKFQAFGRTLEEAFANAGLAMVSFMWDWSMVESRLTKPVRVEGRDLEQLLSRFLNEVLFVFERERFLLGRVERLAIRESGGRFALEAELVGDSLAPRYEVSGEVKAVTYNEMKIERDDGCLVQVVVDL
jgi:SHS2 domain-containing protein